jgi:hypothetical protein
VLLFAFYLLFFFFTAAACHDSTSPAHMNQTSLKAHPPLLFSSSAISLSTISFVVTHSLSRQTYSSTTSTRFLRFRACCLVIDQARHDTTEQMGQEKQHEVPCKQQQTAASGVFLDSPSMPTSNSAELMTGGHGSRKISSEVTDYTVS